MYIEMSLKLIFLLN